MDEAAWGALTLSLTILGGVWTWFTWRRRGVAPAMRAAGITLLAPAAYLTKTLRMFTRIVDAIGDWAVSLVFSPTVWLGVVLAGVGVGLFLLGGVLTARGVGTRDRSGSGRSAGRPAVEPGRASPAGSPAGKGAPAVVDDDMAEIEALLRKRGIS